MNMNLCKLCAMIGTVLLFAFPYSIQAEESAAAPMIVGGQPADPGEYPFMVALMVSDKSDGFRAHYCGGILIDPEWVLTTANCALEDTPNVIATEERESIDIGLGFHDLSDSPDAERIVSSNIHVHPDYNTQSSENDIALIQLSSPATGYSLAQYATSEAQNSVGTSAIAIGWGMTSELSVFGSGGYLYPDVLHEVDLPIVANEDCNAWRRNVANVLLSEQNVLLSEHDMTADMLCAGYREGGKDACNSDGGGPLFYYEDGLPIVVGLISWGTGCAQPDLLGVYTRVSYFADWIDSHVSVQNEGVIPSAVTLNSSQTGVKMSGMSGSVLWGVALTAQVSLVALVLHRRAG